MANDKVCVFCGEKLGFFSTGGFTCGGVWQPVCKTCAAEVWELSEVEQCRRALKLGLALQPEQLESFIALSEEAEARRPACLRCGKKLKFLPMQRLDNTPLLDSLMASFFSVQPARCEGCGKLELYDPDILEKDPVMVQLIKTDKAE